MWLQARICHSSGHAFLPIYIQRAHCSLGEYIAECWSRCGKRSEKNSTVWLELRYGLGYTPDYVVYHEALKESIFGGLAGSKERQRSVVVGIESGFYLPERFVSTVIDTQKWHSDGMGRRFTSHVLLGGWFICAIIQLAQASLNSSLTVIWELVGPEDIHPQSHVDWCGSWHQSTFFIIFHTAASVPQVMYTVKEYMQTVTAVDPYWLAEPVQLRCHAQVHRVLE